LFKKILLFSNSTLRLTLEICVVFIILIAIAVGGLMWRLSQGPISVSFAKSYIEEALSQATEDLSVRVEDIVFSWPDFAGRFQLDVTGLRVQKGTAADASALAIDNASIGLSRRALFFGQIRPVSVMLKSPTLELVRTKEGRLNLTIENKEIIETDTTASSQSAEEQIAHLFKDMAGNREGRRNFLSRLDAFVIEDASVAVRDQQYGLSWYMTDLDFSIREERQGTAAALMVDLPGGQGRDASIAIEMVYRKGSDDFRAAARFKDINPAFISRFLSVPDELQGQDLFFSGDFEAAADTNLSLATAKFHGTIPEGVVTIANEYDAPIPLKDIVIDTEYNRAEEALNISKIAGSIGGIAFDGAGKAEVNEDRISLPIMLSVEQASREDVAALFPKSEHDGDAYEWVGRRISGGQLSNAKIAITLTGDKKKNEETQSDYWDIDAPELIVDFDFEEAKVQYSDTLMPAENGKGKGHLDLGKELLEITEASASLGAAQGSDVTVRVTDLMKSGAGYVTVDAQVKGPMASALEYIAADPINMNKAEIGIDYKTVKGDVDLNVKVGLPTLADVPKEDVKVDINGTINNALLPGVVNGLDLSGGPLNVATEPGGFRVKGSAKLAGRETTLEWHQNFDASDEPYSMQVKAKIGADKELRNHFGVDLDDYISGTLPIDVLYTFKGGDSSVEIVGDLNPIRLYIDPFKFEKPIGVPGSVSAKAILKNDVLKEVQNISLNAKGIEASNANITFAPRGDKQADLNTGTLPSVTLGQSKMEVNFAVSTDNVMKIDVKASVFDALPFLQETESSKIGVEAQGPKKKVQPMTVKVSADQMILQNQQSAKSTLTYLEMDDEGDITRMEYDAKVGKGDIMVRFRPDETGKRTFLLKTDDAGSVLYAGGLYDNVHGGTLTIFGEPQGGDLRGDLYGSMRMENFRVVKAPALASLLSLMSLTGVTQLLGNEGLVFSKLESDFEWRFRPDGNILVIKDGKTSGSSIGLTFGGHLNRGTKTTDISGTIIPMTEINSILSKIPLLGNILGGETGLIAATYTMRGPSSNPTVAVNPLSVLAPGFLRNILFESGYSRRIPNDDAPPAAPTAPVENAPSHKAKEGVNR
jgi:hypothetical protein